MKRFFIRFFAFFIPNKQKRKDFRNKYYRKFNVAPKETKVIVKNATSTTNTTPSKKMSVDQKIDVLYRMLDNINYKQNLIMDYYFKPSDAMPANGAKSLLQKEMLDILLIFKSIVDKHNLSYWIDYGTLLGAVRHGGFIPWDDDIDVSIMEDDIEEFQEIFERELPDNYEFVNHWIGRVYRIVKKDSEYLSFIDIYPYLIYGSDEEGNYKIRTRHGGDKPRIATYRPHRPLPHGIIFPQIELEFCGHKFKAPREPDKYLRLKYGNYHVLPKSKHIEPGHITLKEDLEFYPDDFVR